MTAPSLAFEIPRYICYAFCFIFGVLMWGTTADKLTATAFGVTYCGGFNETNDSPFCNVLIGFGVIMMLVLLAAIVWHSLIFFDKPFMPYLVELITFSVLAFIWFILGIVAVAISPKWAQNTTEVRTVIAGGWMAGFLHTAVAVLAFFELRSDGGEGKLKESLPTTAPGAVPMAGQQYVQGQTVHAPQQPYTQQVPMGTPMGATPVQPVAPMQPVPPMQAVPPMQPAAPVQPVVTGQ